MWSNEDYNQLKTKNIDIYTVEQQIDTFKKGIDFINICRAATVNDGLIKMDEYLLKNKAEKYDMLCKNKQIIKFVPASGAASRMFKFLFEFKDSDDKKKSLKIEEFNSAYHFFKNINKFAFTDDLKSIIGNDKFKNSDKLEVKTEIVNALLNKQGLNYGNKPKGLLKFHKYSNSERTPVHEHLIEGALYTNTNGLVNIHFTVSPEHIDDFNAHVDTIKSRIENEYNVKFNIEFSVQKPSTDTIAVDINNEVFRNDDHSLLFRPGGHGALIHNLNELDADIIFIKNIDNIVPDSLKQTTVDYKKALGTLLIEHQELMFAYIEQLENNEKLTESDMSDIEDFMIGKLSIIPHDAYKNKSRIEKIKYLKNKLNRPLRVCGMVKNQGEPGGGPFWAVNTDKSISLQIVEASQINYADNNQLNILRESTHFNPVDLVCATKDYKGNKFDLTKYIDWSTCFISNKSKDGKNLKALELPGLWNGAMSDWNTIFVEVDLLTFNPVKTINDLLRPEHLSHENLK